MKSILRRSSKIFLTLLLAPRALRAKRMVLIQASGAVLLAAAHLGMAQNTCEALKNLKLDHGEVVSAKWVEAGMIQVQLGFPPKPESLPAKRHCEINVVSRPTSDSVINFTLWMPPQEDWNGKYLQLGSGGWGGTIQAQS